MTKQELIEALQGFMDETDIRVCPSSTNDVTDIDRVTYQPSKGETPAFLCLVIPACFALQREVAK